MVALEAMSFGRKALWAMTQEEQKVDAAQSLLTELFSGVSGGRDPARAPVLRASRKAAAMFWCLLQDFVSLQSFPPSWLVQVPQNHPFLGVVPGQGECAGRLVLNPPPGANFPEQI
jgi:hypothetical protein